MTIKNEDLLSSVEHIQENFEKLGYICNIQIATAVFLAYHLEKPILIEGPPGVGKTYDMVARPIPVNQVGGYEILEFEPPTYMKLRLWQSTSKGTTWYRLEPFEDGTRLTYTTEVSVGPMAKLFEPIIGWSTTRTRGPRMLSNLKQLLESDTGG